MSKLTNEELEAIVQRDLPGRRLMQRPTNLAVDAMRASATTNAEAQAPSLDKLRRKYLGENAGSATTPCETLAGALDAVRNSNTDDEIVVTGSSHSNQERDPWQRDAGPKTAVVSGPQRKIIGSQG